MSSGCCHFRCHSRSAGPQPLPPSLAAEYAGVKPNEFLATEKELAVRAKYTIKQVEFPALTALQPSSRKIVLEYYSPSGPGKKPVILVLPILGGSYDVEKYFASYFAKRGLAAVIVHREQRGKDPENADELNALLKQTVLDNKLAIDWVESRADLDPDRIGVFGASMGGIKGALLTPLEKRVRAAVLGLVGGDLPYILAESTEAGIARRRKALLQSRQITVQELQAQLQKGIRCDPNTFAPYIDRQKVLLILAACDTVVPIKKGLELRAKMGKPETILVPTGHYSALLCIPLIQSASLKFFKKKFAEPALISGQSR